MYNFITVIHVMMAFALIIAIVIFQTSKGSALSMFGGGGDALFNSASGTSACPVMTMMGMVQPISAKVFTRVMPSISGIRTSVMIQPC